MQGYFFMNTLIEPQYRLTGTAGGGRGASPRARALINEFISASYISERRKKWRTPNIQLITTKTKYCSY